MTKGFFSPTAWTAQKRPLRLIPDCSSCGLYAKCKSPFMPVSGKGKRKILIVAEAPGENEDKKGIQLIGNAGMELVRILDGLDINMREDCWLTNSVICRPMDENGYNREPTGDEIDFCRPNLVKTIKELSPDVIIPLGKVAIDSIMPLAWKDGEVKDVGTWVGWQIPSQKLNSWICPTYHPSYLLRVKDNTTDKVVELHTTEHLRKAIELNGKPWTEIPDWESKVRVIMNAESAVYHIKRVCEIERPIAFDYETTTLKPDGKDAHILCCSMSDGDTTIAYPWIGEARLATQEFLISSTPKIGANIQFEERWTRKEFGHGVKNWLHDTVLCAHWLDCRRGICSLKFQAFVLLGMSDYDSHLKPYMKGKSKSDNSPNRLKEVEPGVLMKYCGYDSLFEFMVYQKQIGGII